MCRGKGVDGRAVIFLGLGGRERLFRPLWPPNLGGSSDGLAPCGPNFVRARADVQTPNPLT